VNEPHQNAPARRAHGRRRRWREGWILIVAMVVFGVLGGRFIISGITHTNRGIIGPVLGFILILGVGGLVAPRITRALRRRP
jgi:hypothetical protein